MQCGFVFFTLRLCFICLYTLWNSMMVKLCRQGKHIGCLLEGVATAAGFTVKWSHERGSLDHCITERRKGNRGVPYIIVTNKYHQSNVPYTTYTSVCMSFTNRDNVWKMSIWIRGSLRCVVYQTRQKPASLTYNAQFPSGSRGGV